MPSFLLFVAIAVGLLGCSTAAPTSSTPPPLPPPPVARGLDGIQRLAVVGYGESQFSATAHNAEPGRTFDEILKYNPYGPTLRPVFELIHQGINWLLERDDAKAASAHVAGVSPRALVANALVEALEASGRFEQVRALDREPVGEERRQTEAIVRISVPSWGLVRVRPGDPALVSAFADVQGQVMMRGTGVVVWEGLEDVTGPERLPMASLTRDPEFARQELTDVLTRAGRRIASELLYAQSAGP
jgi:hypothetical protein